MRLLLSIILFCLVDIEQANARCEKSRNNLNCNGELVEDSEIKTHWSEFLSVYLIKLRDLKLSTQVSNDDTGLGIKNLGIYSSELNDIQQGYFNKISNGYLIKLVFQDVKMKGKLKKSHFEGLERLEILELNNGPDFEPDAFDDLKKLRAFRLNKSPVSEVPSVVKKMLINEYGSQIILKNTQIEDFSLENLPKWFEKNQASEFDINGSKLRCDVSMVDLRNAMNSDDIFVKRMVNSKSRNFICQSPEGMKNRPLADISKQELERIPVPERTATTTTTESAFREDIIVPEDKNKNENSNSIQETNNGQQQQEGYSPSPLDVEGTEVGVQTASAIGIGVAFAVILLLILLAILIWFCCKKKKTTNQAQNGQRDVLLSSPQP